MQANKIDKYTKEVLEELKNTKQQIVLSPSQDFYKNNMVYSFLIPLQKQVV